ncbi:hypothetical protein [Massilia glaciei]|uniref:DUF4124 domain-containing protein n=1 Tax=Massilia glaciei TaxID=1524097 RepID=A0A2U2HJD0_9BURK|nr:hypothetical protein [Massilia glaciei]PWF46801.1 hypothetical protein C7C56_015055 [Massilia glaciei]
MKNLPHTIIGAALAFACLAGAAAPAPWYAWVSKLDGKRVCSQSPLGPGWVRASGPYKNSQCVILSAVK